MSNNPTIQADEKLAFIYSDEKRSRTESSDSCNVFFFSFLGGVFGNDSFGGRTSGEESLETINPLTIVNLANGLFCFMRGVENSLSKYPRFSKSRMTFDF